MTRNEALQIAKPILFNTEMVRAIQNNRKTVTRRIIKIPETAHMFFGINPETGKAEFLCGEVRNGLSADWEIGIKFPYQVGDILYVRETWWRGVYGQYCYLANYDRPDLTKKQLCKGHKCRPSIHMPKEAARVFLRVTGVRVERLQDITDEQAIAEGINIPKTASDEERCLLALARYPKLWNSTVKKSDLDKYGWDANPWVSVTEFERVEVSE